MKTRERNNLLLGTGSSARSRTTPFFFVSLTIMGRTARFVVAGLVSVALVLGLARLLFPPVPDEQRIRRQIRRLERGFTAGEVRACLRPLHAEFVEERTGWSRDEIRAALVYHFHSDRNPRTGRPRYRVDLPDDEIDIRLDPGGDGAEATLVAEFRPAGDDEPAPVWTIEVESSLERTGDGWRFREASHRTVAGRRPF